MTQLTIDDILEQLEEAIVFLGNPPVFKDQHETLNAKLEREGYLDGQDLVSIKEMVDVIQQLIFLQHQECSQSIMIARKCINYQK